MNVQGSIVKVGRLDSVQVLDNQGNKLVQIPATYIECADIVLGDMCRRGNVSPELKIWIGETPEGPTMWNCGFGSYRCSSVTPWGALIDMAMKLKALNDGR